MGNTNSNNVLNNTNTNIKNKILKKINKLSKNESKKEKAYELLITLFNLQDELGHTNINYNNYYYDKSYNYNDFIVSGSLAVIIYAIKEKIPNIIDKILDIKSDIDIYIYNKNILYKLLENTNRNIYPLVMNKIVSISTLKYGNIDLKLVNFNKYSSKICTVKLFDRKINVLKPSELCKLYKGHHSNLYNKNKIYKSKHKIDTVCILNNCK